MEQQGRYPVIFQNTPVGHVTVAQQGLLTVFDCSCTCDCREVLRLAAVCGGHFVPLGVLIPEADGLHCKKSFSKSALQSLGFGEPDAYRLIRQGEVYIPAVEPTVDMPPELESSSAEEPPPQAITVPQAVDADGWIHVSTPGVLFNDAGLAAACSNVHGALLTAREGYEYLAVPLSLEEPFPLMSIFCFGTPSELRGRSYLIFKIKDGNLTLP